MSFALPWSPTMEPTFPMAAHFFVQHRIRAIPTKPALAWFSLGPCSTQQIGSKFKCSVSMNFKYRCFNVPLFSKNLTLSIFLGLPKADSQQNFKGKSTLVYQPNWWFHDLPIFLAGFCRLTYVGLFIGVYLGIDTWCPPLASWCNPH